MLPIVPIFSFRTLSSFSMSTWSKALSGLALTFLSYKSVSFHRSCMTWAQMRSLRAKKSCSLRRFICEDRAGSWSSVWLWGPLRVCWLSKSLNYPIVVSAFWPTWLTISETTCFRDMTLTWRTLSRNSLSSCLVAYSSGRVYSWDSFNSCLRLVTIANVTASSDCYTSLYVFAALLLTSSSMSWTSLTAACSRASILWSRSFDSAYRRPS